MHSPHDKYLKANLKNIVIARDFIKSAVPKAIYTHLDLTTLQLTDKEFVTGGYKKIESDIVYSCQIAGRPGYIYCLIEHQSTADKMMPFRMLRYRVNLMAEHIKQFGNKLPMVVPICIYNGKNIYPYSSNIYDCFEHPDLARKSDILEYKLIDLAAMTDQQIMAGGSEALMNYFLKHSRQRDLIKFLEQEQKNTDLRNLFARLSPEIDILMTMQYICAVVKYRDGHATRIFSIMAQLIGEEEVMRFEDALKQESFNTGLAEGKLAGKLEGKLEGRQEISKHVALQLLRRGTPANDVAQIVDITLEQVIDLTAELEH